MGAGRAVCGGNEKVSFGIKCGTTQATGLLKCRLRGGMRGKIDYIRYYKEVYSKFWINKTANYGYEQYAKRLVGVIIQSGPKHVFEVGIGTGWPIGTALKKKGIRVDGCDVADNLVALAQKEFDNEEGIWVGEVTEYQGNTLYDVTYCVRVSWYIPDFYAVLRKMYSMTKPGGYPVFDVMDRNSPYCLRARLNGVRDKYYRFLGIETEEDYKTNFISLFQMKRFLKKWDYPVRIGAKGNLRIIRIKYHTPKVVFVCRKGKEKICRENFLRWQWREALSEWDLFPEEKCWTAW